MKRGIIIAVAIILVVGLALWAKSNIPSNAQKTEQTQQQTEDQSLGKKAEEGDKGKIEQFGEVPPAPGDEEAASQKQEQKEEQKEEINI